MFCSCVAERFVPRLLNLFLFFCFLFFLFLFSRCFLNYFFLVVCFPVAKRFLFCFSFLVCAFFLLFVLPFSCFSVLFVVSAFTFFSDSPFVVLFLCARCQSQAKPGDLVKSLLISCALSPVGVGLSERFPGAVTWLHQQQPQVRLSCY